MLVSWCFLKYCYILRINVTVGWTCNFYDQVHLSIITNFKAFLKKYLHLFWKSQDSLTQVSFLTTEIQHLSGQELFKGLDDWVMSVVVITVDTHHQNLLRHQDMNDLRNYKYH